MPLHDPTGEGDWLSRSGGDPQTLSIDSEGNFRLGTDGDPCFDEDGNLLYLTVPCEDISTTLIPKYIYWRGFTFPLVYTTIIGSTTYFTYFLRYRGGPVERYSYAFTIQLQAAAPSLIIRWGEASQTFTPYEITTRYIEWDCTPPDGLDYYSAWTVFMQGIPPWETTSCTSSSPPAEYRVLPSYDTLRVYGADFYVESNYADAAVTGVPLKYRYYENGVYSEWTEVSTDMKALGCWSWTNMDPP